VSAQIVRRTGGVSRRVRTQKAMATKNTKSHEKGREENHSSFSWLFVFFVAILRL
jgi:hypothetical protein